jgi:hypothetical protein
VDTIDGARLRPVANLACARFASAGKRAAGTENASVRGTYRPNPFGPVIGRSTDSESDTVRRASREVAAFVRDTIEYFTSRGYLPANPERLATTPGKTLCFPLQDNRPLRSATGQRTTGNHGEQEVPTGSTRGSNQAVSEPGGTAPASCRRSRRPQGRQFEETSGPPRDALLPVCCPFAASSARTRRNPAWILMGRAGFEPATLGLKVPCSTS